MTGRDPLVVGSLLERLRNIGASDLRRAEGFGGRLVRELADRATLVGRVLLVTEDLGGGGTAHRHRQDDDPGAPAGAASCELGLHGSSVDHPFSTLAEIARWGKKRGGNAIRRRSLAAGSRDRGVSVEYNPA